MPSGNLYNSTEMEDPMENPMENLLYQQENHLSLSRIRQNYQNALCFPAFSDNATVPDPAGSPWVAAAILPDSQDLPGCCARGTLQRPGMKFYPKTWGVGEIVAGDLHIKYQKGDKSRRQGE